MLFHHMTEPESPSYIEQSAIILKGDFNIDGFQQKITRLTLENDIFRTIFFWKGTSRPWQIVLSKKENEVRYEDHTHLTGIEQKIRQKEMLGRIRQKGFDLQKDPLLKFTICKIDNDCHICLISFHHIILDGWSISLLSQQLFSPSDIEALDIPPFKNFISYLEKKDTKHALNYWKKRLKGIENPATLRIPRSGQTQFSQHAFTIDEQTCEKMILFLAGQKTTLSMFLQLCWSIVLSRFTGGDDVIVGVTLSGRPPELEKSESMLGLFVNTIPVRITVKKNLSFKSFLQKCRDENLDDMSHNYLSLADIQQVSPLGKELVQSLFVLENHPRPTDILDTGLKIESQSELGFSQTNYNLNLILSQENTIQGRCQYNESVLAPWEVNVLIEDFKHIVDIILTDPDINISDIQLVTKEEEKKIITDFNKTEQPISKSATFLDLFEKSVAAYSEKPAIVYDGSSISYGELDKKTSILAHILYQKAEGERSRGEDLFVATYLNRSIEYIIAMIAAMKAGCAYVPLAVDAPEQRIEFQIKEIRPVAMITQDGLLDIKTNNPFGLKKDKILDIYDNDLFKQATPEDWDTAKKGQIINTQPVPEDLAYMIYTSGTTGNPKGVMIEHGSLFNLIEWYTKKFFLSSTDEVTAYAPFVFDASVWEIFPALSRGASLHIFTEKVRRDIIKIQTYLKEHKITICYFLSQVAELIDGRELDSLRLMLSGGDVISKTACDGNYAHWNTYGPTEFTVTATCYLLDGTFPVPIGTPVGNSKAYILDENRQLVGIGKPGELYLAGIQAARGYFNHPELTVESFFPSPFHPELRMYKTGDLCRFLPEGQIEYLGRKDKQVKVNGYRIELSEIEKILKDIPKISQAVVIHGSEDKNDGSLHAYLVIQKNAKVEKEHILKNLKDSLPAYMIPADIIQVDKIPYTISGKIDKKKIEPLNHRTPGPTC